MESYQYLLDIAIILLSTKVLGLISRKFQMPQVVGALLGGLFLGPAMLGLIKETELIHQVAEIGVIVLMFCAGLETDIKELGKAGKASFIIAMLGVLVPLAGGFGIACIFNRPGVIESTSNTSLFLQNMFIGVILTASKEKGFLTKSSPHDVHFNFGITRSIFSFAFEHKLPSAMISKYNSIELAT
jgi:Kef-type K+ transport system membrane component KefB